MLVTACVQNTGLYYWGNYEDQVHKMYSASDTSSPDQQILALEAIVEKAKSKGKALPPGFHAHLGYEYALSGKQDLATQQFEIEKEQYPESAVYMNLLMDQIKPKQGQDSAKI